ncbi:hypothetical protein B0H19DRAFT_1254998 [Mycena capillaripes]|nr:hypothetical protein B0H19DRAFT_1254998 [Mycena capillaripes]
MDSDSLATADKFLYITQVYFCAMCTILSLPPSILAETPLRRGGHLGLAHQSAARMEICLEDPLDSSQDILPLLPASPSSSYWVIAVVPYLLYSFVMDHSLERCQKIYKVPVALALWNQVGSESVLLIRTYAFFNRNIYVLWFLLSAISGVVAYQLYVDTTQMLLLPFFKPPFDRGPCFPMSKPHSAHLLGFFIAPLLFDTIVTLMTVWKAFTIRRRNGGPNSRLIQTFLREGVFYYILISIANLINGIFYLQPRQVISAINIPLSVMMAPVLACRLILDLRERGSETVSHSEGTGIAAFTTKSMTQQQCSPFTPPNHRTKIYTRNARVTDSNIVLSTLGSIPPDMDIEQDIAELENIRLGLGLDLGLSMSTAVGGDDGEPICDEKEEGSPAPAYTSRALEMGFRAASRAPSIDSDFRGIRVTVDVEKATATM